MHTLVTRSATNPNAFGQILTINASTGSSQANQVTQTRGDGRLDPSLLVAVAPNSLPPGSLVYASTSDILSVTTAPNANGIWYNNGSNVPTSLAAGVNDQVLLGNTGAAPSWGKITNNHITDGTINLATKVTGVLSAVNGGTGYGTYAVGDMLFASSTTALSRLAVGAAGTILAGGSTPSWVSPSSLNIPLKYTTTVGDGATTSFTVTHGLGTFDITVAFSYSSSGQVVSISYDKPNANQISFTVIPALSTNQIRVTVIG